MPTRPRPQVTASWTIHSVPVRTRDGAERLDQGCRCLLNDAPAAAGPHIPSDELQAQSLPVVLDGRTEDQRHSAPRRERHDPLYQISRVPTYVGLPARG